VGLLGEADRVEAVAGLVGVAALPDQQRVALLTGRLLREAVLQQSALSERDAWCAPVKQSALLRMVLDLHDRAGDLVRQGVPAARIEELDLSDAARARERGGPEDVASVTRVSDELLARLDALG
jgi:V/A-type H+-transporting ATPase subunit A